jgi:hypothetical protein
VVVMHMDRYEQVRDVAHGYTGRLLGQDLGQSWQQLAGARHAILYRKHVWKKL